MLIWIRKWTDGTLLREIEADNLRAAVETLARDGANLTRANLTGAKNINKFLTTPLYMLLDQPGLIRAYKLVTDKNTGPHYPGTVYQIGHEYAVTDADCDEAEECSRGINLCTLDFCMLQWRPGYRILIAEFTASEIAAIPVGSDGKFRVHRCKIVGEKDLVELGLTEKED